MASKDLPGCSKQEPPAPGRRSYALSTNTLTMLNEIEGWSSEEKYEMLCEMMKGFADDPGTLKKIHNFARDMANKAKKNMAAGSLDLPNVEACGQQRKVDPSAPHSAASLLPPPTNSAPATLVPMICRGDLLADAKVLFFDTEKVTVAESHENLSGDISIVDTKGRLLFWSYIHQDNVCMYNTKLTGLNKEKMEMGLPNKMICEILNRILKGKEIWGASTSMDVKSLGYAAKNGIFKFPTASATKDIQDFYRDYKDQAISLGVLSEHFLGENAQSNTHSSITDARITALCYRKMLAFQKLGMKRFSCPLMDELRSLPKPKKKPGEVKMTFDKCKCGKTHMKKVRGMSVQQQFSSFKSFDFDSV